MKWLELVLVCLCSSLLLNNYVLADVHQLVQPSPCSSSPQDAADSLDVLLSGWSRMSDVMKLQLAPGEHCVRNFSLVRDLEDRGMVGNGSAVIRCTAGVGLAFYNLTRFSFSNIVLDGCGLELDYVDDFLEIVRADIDVFLELTNYSDQYVALLVGNSQDFEMESTSIINTMGLGLLAVNVVGSSHLTNVRFEHNVPLGCFHPQYQFFTLERIGGGALFVYHDYLTSREPSASLEIRNSTFHGNSYCGFSFGYNLYSHYSNGELERLLGGGGGLSFLLPQLQYGVSAAVYDSVFTNNTSLYGGGVFISIYTGVHGTEMVFEGCVFTSNGVDESVAASPLYALFGTALGLFTDIVQPNFEVSRITRSFSNTVHLIGCNFENNTAFTGVVTLLSLYNLVLPGNDRSGLQFNFTRCVFQGNKAVRAPAVYAYELKTISIQPGALIALEDIQVTNNKVLALVSTTKASGVLHIEHVNFTLAGKSLLQHNVGSALRAISTSVFIQGDVSFHNNTAPYGGGLSLVDNSVLVVAENTSITFTNNTAAVAGGAIFVELSAVYMTSTTQVCFLYFSNGFLCSLLGGSFCGDITKMGVTIRFAGNKASLGGMIYGSTLHTCLWAVEFMKKYAPGVKFSDKNLYIVLHEGKDFRSPLQFDRLPDDSAAVSTPIVSLTARDPMKNSSISHLNLAPGITKRIELATRDAFGYLVPGVVTSRSSTAGASSVIGSSFIFTGHNRTRVGSLSVSSTAANREGSSVEVSLYTVDTFSEVLVNVSFTVCPGGFYFNSTYNNCTCLEGLDRFSVTCTPSGGLIVPVNTWVGMAEGRVQLVVCSFDFCSPLVSRVIVDPNKDPFSGPCNSDYHRYGPGCGGCEANYSSVFGSSHCLKCSNSYILLVLLFAALGIFLMAAMLLLRISIAGGFLNGILFFSNIVSLYSSLYAPAVSSSFLLFSWFSLKFGIQSCFFDGMRPLHVAALNFAFPLYLHILVLLVILLARLSTRFAEWLFVSGSSPPKIFVTIYVMTYSSLLESCIQAISFTTLQVVGPEGTVSEHRWRFDPNQRYFHGAHGALAAFSILLLVFYIIPAPILWMTPPKVFNIDLLRRCKPLYVRFKPIHDAIWAPLKPRYFFWVSLRLYFRFPPLLFLSFLPVPENLLMLSCFLLIVAFLHGVIQPFQGMAQNVFDNFLQLVLLTLSVASLYFARLQPSVTRGNVEALNMEVSELIGMQRPAAAALLLVIHGICGLIFLWHLWTSFPRLRRWMTIMWNRIVGGLTNHFQVDKKNPPAMDNTATRCVSITYSELPELRESLLDEPSGLADLKSIK